MRLQHAFLGPDAQLSPLGLNIGTSGNDLLSGGRGFDVLVALAGDDSLFGAGGTDILVGGTGEDELSGDAGNDILIGGYDGDAYVIDTQISGADRIVDNGNAPVVNGYYSSGLDIVRLEGFASTDDALHSIGVERAGDDLILTYDNAATGTTGSITISSHFAGPQYALEGVEFGDGLVYHVAYLSGDAYTYSVHSGPDLGGEDLVLGSDASEEIYSGIGNDIIAGFAGADHFMFHDEEDSNGSHDLILDFELGLDKLDFTDILGMSIDDVTVADNGWGNAVVTTVYGTIELDGIAAADVTALAFAFA